MKIVTEIYNDDDILRNRVEEYFCNNCGNTVKSKNLLFTCVKYVTVQNQNIDVNNNSDGFKFGENKFKCCSECLEKLKAGYA